MPNMVHQSHGFGAVPGKRRPHRFTGVEQPRPGDLRYLRGYVRLVEGLVAAPQRQPRGMVLIGQGLYANGVHDAMINDQASMRPWRIAISVNSD